MTNLFRMWNHLVATPTSSFRLPRSFAAAALLGLAILAGCNSSSETDVADSDGQPTPPLPQEDESDFAGRPSPTGQPNNNPVAAPISDTAMAPSPTKQGGGDLLDQLAEPPELELATPPSQATEQLKANLSPDRLAVLLATADREMEMALTMQSDASQQERLAQAKKIADAKLQAARRLASHPDATPEQMTLGKRAELQGLSHLAQLGDLRSAELLEDLASEYVRSESDDLKVDSQLVLIGFGLERLQNGDEQAADDLVQLNRELIEITSDRNVMAIVAMAQARQWLAKLDHPAESDEVRRMILDKFGASSDPNVSAMAAQYAGNVKFDAIDQLVAKAIEGQTINPTRWREAVETLLREAPDLLSVRYLCGTTLQFESGNQPELADITYEILEQRFADDTSAMGQDVQLALELRDARAEKIGQPIDVPLRSIYGTVDRMEQLQGQVVLMPFWSTRFQDSLQLIPTLQKLESEFPDDVSVVGMNLDPSDDDVRGWMAQAGLELPTVALQQNADESVKVSPVARQFGMGGRPMTVILDRQGIVRKILFGDQNLRATVEALVQADAGEDNP
ncbi:thiol-disulfide oxidoreductase [Crateriforma conspicua]|uniref:Thiol-disulfide oxidoreductase n=2 Tax=Crateriforma conspicua TaxID=2527996 RepID=A0A5C6FXB3_9PLAN|nr:thiol-disulfide oxidoreductase [Crateriforma conspicua]